MTDDNGDDDPRYGQIDRDDATRVAQRTHCEEALADTCTMTVRPVIDRLAASITGGATDA